MDDVNVFTWNVAAINNNPFEYWITHDDPLYAKLMGDVEAFLESPEAFDIPISDVFSQGMFGELLELMGSMTRREPLNKLSQWRYLLIVAPVQD